jgi:hypothetical protein
MLYTIPDEQPKLPRASRVPNLDAFDAENLFRFATAHQDGKNSKHLFPKGGHGTKGATAKLAEYAIKAHFARLAREHGDLESAAVGEAECRKLYEALPAYAKWAKDEYVMSDEVKRLIFGKGE